MTVALACVALLGLLVVGLGFTVSMTRRARGTSVGFKDDPADTLYKLVRAHGNATEYCPMFALLIFVLGTRDPSTGALWWMGIATASRYVHAAGMILSPTLARAHPARFLGATGTYLAGFGLVASLLLSL